MIARGDLRGMRYERLAELQEEFSGWQSSSLRYLGYQVWKDYPRA